ncbi:hypothetical protein UA45_06285 [Morganella morganii]|uniref:DUF5405 domain-containing protein n=1 Tax=Morganella morganii TaxID=582 RepID=A0A0D8L9G3_MORMO|nr:hypothetical protein UA45_06285 [Morganella morganii]
MSIIDPRNGIYITDTRYAIVHRLPEEHASLPAYALIEADLENNSWSLVSRYDNPVVMVADLVAMQVIRPKDKPVKTLDEYLLFSEMIVKRCQTALSVLREMPVGGRP